VQEAPDEHEPELQHQDEFPHTRHDGRSGRKLGERRNPLWALVILVPMTVLLALRIDDGNQTNSFWRALLIAGLTTTAFLVFSFLRRLAVGEVKQWWRKGMP
jgi:hypothetical protein